MTNIPEDRHSEGILKQQSIIFKWYQNIVTIWSLTIQWRLEEATATAESKASPNKQHNHQLLVRRYKDNSWLLAWKSTSDRFEKPPSFRVWIRKLTWGLQKKLLSIIQEDIKFQKRTSNATNLSVWVCFCRGSSSCQQQSYNVDMLTPCCVVKRLQRKCKCYIINSLIGPIKEKFFSLININSAAKHKQMFFVITHSIAFSINCF